MYKRIPYFCSILFLLFLNTYCFSQTKEFQKLIEGGKYKQAYEKLYTSYLKQPNNFDNLWSLSQYYSLNGNSEKNFRLAYYFTQQSKNVFIEAVQKKDGSKIYAWKKKGIDLTAINQRMADIAQWAFEEAQQANTLEAYQSFMTDFSSHYNLVVKAIDLQTKKAFELACQENTKESYDHFLQQYPRSKEQKEAQKKKAFLLYKKSVSGELPDNNKTLNYAHLEEEQLRQKNEAAYKQASLANTSKAFRAFLLQNPTSANYDTALIQYQQLQYNEQTADGSVDTYLHFLKNYDANNFWPQAADSLVSKAWKEKNRKALDVFLTNYPRYYYTNDILDSLYIWYTQSGELPTWKTFKQQYPDYLYTYLQEQDSIYFQTLDSVDTRKPFNEKDFEQYDYYIKKFMNKDIAFVLLQRTLSNFMSSRNYRVALQRAQQFELVFEGNTQYTELLQLLANKSAATKQRTALIQNLKSNNHIIVSPDGQTVYSSVEENGTWNICESRKTRSGFSAPEKLRTLNKANANQVPYSISYNGKKMLFGRNNQIFMAENINGNWIEKEQLPATINSGNYNADATFLPDESGILYVSDKPYGTNLQPSFSYFHGDVQPATDIYFVPKTAAGWGEPINLGLDINTQYAELSPVLSADMQTLFFCSDGQGGVGHLDIYMSKKLDKNSWTKWSSPINIGTLANTEENEYSVQVAPNGEGIYFTSGGANNPYTLYYASLLAPLKSNLQETKVKLLHSQKADVLLVDLNTQNTLEKLTFYDSTTTYNLLLDKGKNYAFFNANNNGICTLLKDSTGNKKDTIVLGIQTFAELQKSENTTELPSIYFKQDKAEIDSCSFFALNVLANQLQQNNYRISIEVFVKSAHNNLQEDFDNSMERAKRIKDFLIEKGIKAERIIPCAWASGNEDQVLMRALR